MSEAAARPDQVQLIDRLLLVLKAGDQFAQLSDDAKRIAIRTLIATLEERMKIEHPEQPAAEPSSA